MPDLSEQATRKRFLRPGQVQDRLGIAPSTLWNYVHDGVITPAHRTPGGHARYRESEVAALEAQLSVQWPEMPVPANVSSPGAGPARAAQWSPYLVERTGSDAHLTPPTPPAAEPRPARDPDRRPAGAGRGLDDSSGDRRPGPAGRRNREETRS